MLSFMYPSPFLSGQRQYKVLSTQYWVPTTELKVSRTLQARSLRRPHSSFILHHSAFLSAQSRSVLLRIAKQGQKRARNPAGNDRMRASAAGSDRAYNLAVTGRQNRPA